MTDISSMAPLIGVTTSEVRRGELATLRRHGEPPQHEMALGLTYMRAVELAGGVPVVLPPLEQRAGDAARRASTASACPAAPTSTPPPTAPARTSCSARPSRRSTASSSSWRAPPTPPGLPMLGVCRGAQTLNVARGGTLNQHIDGHRQTELATQPVHAVRIAASSRARAAARQPHAPRSTPSTTRRSTRSATASSPPRGRRTAPSRRSRTRAIRSSSASSGTPRRWSTTRPSWRCSARSSTPQAAGRCPVRWLRERSRRADRHQPPTAPRSPPRCRACAPRPAAASRASTTGRRRPSPARASR